MADVLILGGGLSGEWALRLAQKKGRDCILYDSKTLNEFHPDFGKFLETHNIPLIACVDDRQLDSVTLAVISPGIPPENEMVRYLEAKKVRIISEIEFAFSFSNKKVIGVTGSNGKTTVTSMTAHILNHCKISAVPCGNYGYPFSRALIESDNQSVFVVELSSFQLERIENFTPLAAALLNMTPDHLDRYTDCNEYYKAKINIFKNMEQIQACIINSDDKETMDRFNINTACIQTVGTKKSDYLVTDNSVMIDNKLLADFSSMNLKGKHNLYNTAFSCALAISAGAELQNVIEGISTFEPIRHRLQYIGTKNNVSFYNDSKATNFDSVIKAVESFRNILLIAGGKFKGGDFKELVASSQGRVKSCFLIGDSAEIFFSNLSEGFKSKISRTLEQAVQDAFKVAEEGDVILLAPGCASFDQFKNYEERGDRFISLCERIINE